MTGRAGRTGCAAGHSNRWRKWGRPELASFLADPGPPLHGRIELTHCTVPGCRFGSSGFGLCIRHRSARARSDHPDPAAWAAGNPAVSTVERAMPADNSDLRAAAQRRREQTLQRARDALRKLEAAGAPSTFDLVARTAEVSRAWLYNEPEIRQAIEKLRAQHRATTSAPVPASQRASDASLLRRLEAAHARNRELATEIHQLREQLARAHGQLRAAG